MAEGDRLHTLLYARTPSEEWHLEHPGKLSPRYDRVQHVTVDGTDCLLFDWKETLQDKPVGLIKETRFTTIPAHVNRDMELSYVYDGTCDFVVGGRSITLSRGDIVIFDTNVVRSAPSFKGENDIVISMAFRRTFFDSVFLSALPGSGLVTELLFESVSRRRRHDHSLIVPAAYTGRARQLMEFITEEYNFPSMYADELIRSYAQALFIELIRGLYQRASEQETAGRSGRKLVDVLAYLEAHYKECSLSSLAARFGYNPNYLGNLIKWNTGKTFSELRLAQQMSEARFLLANTDQPITYVAQKVGITNMTYFYQKFRSLYHMSPKTYRASASAGQGPWHEG